MSSWVAGAEAIVGVRALEVLDSRGNPTIEVHVAAKRGRGAAIAPSGASTGVFEAVELRDGGSRYGGKGVTKAVYNVNKIIGPCLLGLPVTDQVAIDGLMRKLDGTKDKGNLGANAIVATSMACAKAAASCLGLKTHEYLGARKRVVLPVPFCNVINGGKHAANGLAFQEYMVAPVGAKSFSEAMEAACAIYHELGKKLKARHGRGSTNVGDEGGFAPPFATVGEPLSFLEEVVGEAGLGGKVLFAMDVAASSFFEKGNYLVDGKKLGAGELSDILTALAKEYPVVSVEDPFEENAFGDFAAFSKKNPKLQVVGDDLLVTNSERIETALKKKACNALLLKPNQAGTLSEAVSAVEAAYSSGWGVMASHRSGDSEDVFIASLAVGLGIGQIKSGAPARGERTSKYNNLLRIEAFSEGKVEYAGTSFRRPVAAIPKLWREG